MKDFVSLNGFLNRIDPLGIAVDGEDEYDIEAYELYARFSKDMDDHDVNRIYADVMWDYFFAEDCNLTVEQSIELKNILSQLLQQ